VARRHPPRRHRPLQPCATAVAKGLPAARLVVDHFHVIRLANAGLDEVRRRVQNDTLGHRGHKADPLDRIRRRLLAGHDRLDAASFTRLLTWLDAGDPQGEVGAAYLARGARARTVARTIARWETPILRWHRAPLTNAATAGTNLIIKNIKRLGFGFRNFDNDWPDSSCAAALHGWQTRHVASMGPRQPRISA
jgi:transposase